MSELGTREVVVDQAPALGDRPTQRPAGASENGSSRDLAHRIAAEMRASRHWRRTSLGETADLSEFDFSGQDLRGVDFTQARLVGALFTGASLAGANFAWADAAHADFTGASGLVGTQFARANLEGALLPAAVHFASYDIANEVAQNGSKLLLTLLLACAYSWLTINSTLDAKLLTDTGASQLPILNAQIPIVNFYALVPLGLVGLSLGTMLQAQRLWAAMAAAPIALPDGTTMADRAGAWLLGPWGAERILRVEQRSFLVRLQALFAAVLGWWLVPLTVTWFWVRYLHRHDWTITVFQLLVLTAGATIAATFLALARRTLPVRYPGMRPQTPDGRRRDLLQAYGPAALVALGVPLVGGLTSVAAIRGIHGGADGAGAARSAGQEQPALALRHQVPALQAGIPEIMSQVGMRPVAQLADAEVSTRLAAVGVPDSGSEAKAQGVRLIGADLRFASAERAFLPLSDLRRADLLGADLWSADLRGTNIAGASFAGSRLFQADLRRARGSAVPVADRTNTAGAVVYVDTLLCGRASFAAANLRYARMGGGDFRGAAFDQSQLQGATFQRARLTHATLDGADLDGADFRGAYGLTPDQVLAARHVGALYDSTLLAALLTRAPARFTGYDAGAIERETERERLSGEDEPDSLTNDETRQRDAVIRQAYDNGTAATPTADLGTQWVTRGHAHPGSTDAVPYGCTMVRGTKVRR